MRWVACNNTSSAAFSNTNRPGILPVCLSVHATSGSEGLSLSLGLSVCLSVSVCLSLSICLYPSVIIFHYECLGY